MIGIAWCAAVENTPLVAITENDEPNTLSIDLEPDMSELDTAESAQYGKKYFQFMNYYILKKQTYCLY